MNQFEAELSAELSYFVRE